MPPRPNSQFKSNSRTRLAEERLYRGWTQKLVASKIRYSRSGYAQLESGLRDGTDDQWLLLSRIFGVPVEDLKKRGEGHDYEKM